MTEQPPSRPSAYWVGAASDCYGPQPMPDRAYVIEALSWHEDEQRGRWGTDYATEVVEHLEAIAKGSIYPHHEPPWDVTLGECRCECLRCYRDGNCLCLDCSDPHHDHSDRAPVTPSRTDRRPHPPLSAPTAQTGPP